MRTLLPSTRWDAHYAAGLDFRPVLEEETATFDERVGAGNDRSALDIGCGTGGFARFLHGRGYTVLGIDYADAAITRANSHSPQKAGISFACRDAEEDSWEDLPVFDLITCRLSYAFIDNKKEFLKKVKTHLAPCGIFYVMTPIVDALPVERKDTGITAEETQELCSGWSTVEKSAIDPQHAIYALSL
ncbi:class I SAM-dependent methyltransferase [Streptomyces microflavus]|uniref:class I SAM-dependent methyltransferase n=1 Tax=Streptomyces microflavus TaxID=1919 RepID=UPI0036D0D0E8